MTHAAAPEADRPSPDAYPHRLDGLRQGVKAPPRDPKPPIGERDHPPHPRGAAAR